MELARNVIIVVFLAASCVAAEPSSTTRSSAIVVTRKLTEGKVLRIRQEDAPELIESEQRRHTGPDLNVVRAGAPRVTAVYRFISEIESPAGATQAIWTHVEAVIPGDEKDFRIHDAQIVDGKLAILFTRYDRVIFVLHNTATGEQVFWAFLLHVGKGMERQFIEGSILGDKTEDCIIRLKSKRGGKDVTYDFTLARLLASPITKSFVEPDANPVRSDR